MRKVKTIFLLGIFYLLSLNNCYSKDDIAIFPKPKKIIYKNFEIILTTNWWITYNKDNKKLFLTTYLSQRLSENFKLTLPKVKLSLLSKGKYIILGTIQDDLIKEVLKKEKIDISELVNPEGYLLDISDNRILITGNEPAGIFYGIQALLQLVKRKGNQIIVPAVKIVDYPKAKFRGVYILDVDLSRIKSQLDMIAKLKMNIALLGSQKYFRLNDRNYQQEFKEIFSYARERFIEPIPDLGTFGAGEPVLFNDLFAAEGIWIEDEHFKFINDEAVPVNPTKHTLINVIRSGDSNIVIESLDKTKIYKEKLDYRIIEGSISYPYSIDNQPTKILRKPNGNIKNGEEVLVSYDYVENKCASWAPWSVPYCPSSERTYEIMFGALENVIQVLNPHYISVGHDEIRGLNRDSRCKKRNLTNAQVLADEVNRLNDFVKSINPNIRLLMWDDMLNPWHNGGDKDYQVQFGGIPGKTSDAIDLIPKDMIIMIWWYDANDSLNKMKNSPGFFETKGFDYLVAGYKDKKNIKDWVELIRDKKKSLGIITTTWDGWENNIEGIKYTAEMGWY
ncbi:MAG: hypothetical protein FJZ16_04310 [Candidatus Omnitrophica bacterium]|nr:hypothetical protein [Candidatus Omnitrophota bacterium]